MKKIKLTNHTLYYSIIERYGWIELHVSLNKDEVLTLKALSRKIPSISSRKKEFIEECHLEMENYKAKEIIL